MMDEGQVQGQDLVTHLTQLIAALESKNTSLKSELASLGANDEPSSSGGRGDSGGRRVTRGSVCQHFCAHHKELMDPAIWSSLPIDVLQMVFARLPLTNIIRLQSLSRAWRLTAKQPGFRQLCADANPNPQFLAWVLEDDRHDLGVFAVRLWDITTRRWHAFEVATPYHHYFNTMQACDGGLVCFVSRMKDKVADPLMIVVANPLTREWKPLPSCPLLTKVQPMMVQIVVDRGTRSTYRVLVVVENGIGGISGWVYSSASRMWASAKSTPDLIFGNQIQWRQYRPVGTIVPRRVCEGSGRGPCVFDGSKARLLGIGEEAMRNSIDHALVGDRLFVLHEDRLDLQQPYLRFVISDCQWPHVSKEVVLVLSGDYEENEFEYVNLQGCRGFLFVTAVGMNWECSDYYTWLYDLATLEWHTVPILPKDSISFGSHVMCELRWDAIP